MGNLMLTLQGCYNDIIPLLKSRPKAAQRGSDILYYCQIQLYSSPKSNIVTTRQSHGRLHQDSW